MTERTATAAFVEGVFALAAQPLPPDVAALAGAMCGIGLASARAGIGAEPVRIQAAVAGWDPERPPTTQPGCDAAALIASAATAGALCVGELAPVPVPLAAALLETALRDASSVRLVEAFAIGCEAQLRVIAAAGPSLERRGWDAVGATGAIGAAISSCIASASSKSVLGRALGISGSQVVGRRDAQGSELGALCAGLAAANGVLSALLAREGFTSPQQMFDAQRGYLHLLVGAPDTSPLTDNWGTRWLIRELPAAGYAGELSAPALILEDLLTAVAR